MKPVTVLLVATLLFFGCSSLVRVPERPFERPGEPCEARDLLSTLKDRNCGLKTFKGVGRITFLESGEKGLIASVAWVGSEPDRLHIVMRNVLGQPVASLASDGKYLYLVSHTERRFYKRRSADSTLERFISVPIEVSDVVSILAGRVPAGKDNPAIVIKNRTEDGYILVLKRRCGNLLERIYLDNNRKDVRKVEMFDARGYLLYSAVFDMMQDIDGYRVPLRLVFSDNNRDRLQLDIYEYWTEVSVSPSMFVLTPQD